MMMYNKITYAGYIQTRVLASLYVVDTSSGYLMVIKGTLASQRRSLYTAICYCEYCTFLIKREELIFA